MDGQNVLLCSAYLQPLTLVTTKRTLRRIYKKSNSVGAPAGAAPAAQTVIQETPVAVSNPKSFDGALTICADCATVVGARGCQHREAERRKGGCRVGGGFELGGASGGRISIKTESAIVSKPATSRVHRVQLKPVLRSPQEDLAHQSMQITEQRIVQPPAVVTRVVQLTPVTGNTTRSKQRHVVLEETPSSFYVDDLRRNQKKNEFGAPFQLSAQVPSYETDSPRKSRKLYESRVSLDLGDTSPKLKEIFIEVDPNVGVLDGNVNKSPDEKRRNCFSHNLQEAHNGEGEKENQFNEIFETNSADESSSRFSSCSIQIPNFDDVNLEDYDFRQSWASSNLDHREPGQLANVYYSLPLRETGQSAVIPGRFVPGHVEDDATVFALPLKEIENASSNVVADSNINNNLVNESSEVTLSRLQTEERPPNLDVAKIESDSRPYAIDEEIETILTLPPLRAADPTAGKTWSSIGKESPSPEIDDVFANDESEDGHGEEIEMVVSLPAPGIEAGHAQELRFRKMNHGSRNWDACVSDDSRRKSAAAEARFVVDGEFANVESPATKMTNGLRKPAMESEIASRSAKRIPKKSIAVDFDVVLGDPTRTTETEATTLTKEKEFGVKCEKQNGRYVIDSNLTHDSEQNDLLIDKTKTLRSQSVISGTGCEGGKGRIFRSQSFISRNAVIPVNPERNKSAIVVPGSDTSWFSKEFLVDSPKPPRHPTFQRATNRRASQPASASATSKFKKMRLPSFNRPSAFPIQIAFADSEVVMETPAPESFRRRRSWSPPTTATSGRKRRNFNDSAFYETKDGLFPSVEERKSLCKMIADSLTSDANQNARGRAMFLKRSKRANKYSLEGEGKREEPEVEKEEEEREKGEGEERVKTFLADEDLLAGKRLKANHGWPEGGGGERRRRREGEDDEERDHLSKLSAIFRGANQDSKGSKMFLRRQASSSEWIVDDFNVRTPPPRVIPFDATLRWMMNVSVNEPMPPDSAEYNRERRCSEPPRMKTSEMDLNLMPVASTFQMAPVKKSALSATNHDSARRRSVKKVQSAKQFLTSPGFSTRVETTSGDEGEIEVQDIHDPLEKREKKPIIWRTSPTYLDKQRTRKPSLVTDL